MAKNQSGIATAWAGLTTALLTLIGAGLHAATEAYRPGTADAYTDVASTVWHYYEAVTNANANANADADGGKALDDVLDPVWNAKALDATSGRIAVQDRPSLMAHLTSSREGSHSGRRPRITSIQVIHDDFAIVRMDDWNSVETGLYILFKSEGRWRIAGQVTAGAAVGTRRSTYSPDTATDDVLRVLGAYYGAVEAGNARILDGIFDAGWHMKNHTQARTVVSEDKPAFLRRVGGRPFPGYVDDRQVADVQVVYDRLAYVRIDKPSTAVVTVFFLLRTDDGWLIVDKAWSNGVGL